MMTRKRERVLVNISLEMELMIQTLVVIVDKLNEKLIIPLVLPKEEFWNLVLSLQITPNIIPRGCVSKQIKEGLEPTIVLVKKLLQLQSRTCPRKTHKNLQSTICFWY